MQTKICSVYDQKAEAFMRPMFVQASGVAMRSFADEVNSGNKESQLVTHPEDFVLYELGTWDDQAGKIVVYDAPKALCNGLDTKRTQATEANPVRAV